MPTPEDLGLQTSISQRLGALGGRLGPLLAGEWAHLTARLSTGGESAGYFLHPMALPVLQLPVWLGPDLPPTDQLQLAEAAAVGYLHVRIQDDQMDEGLGAGAGPTLLSAALLTRHQALLAGVVGHARGFWPLFEEIWLVYGEAMLAEHALQRGKIPYTRERFAAVLERSSPLLLPGAGALFARGREDLLPALRRFVAALALSHQLLNDLVDAEKDLRSGNRTWVSERFGGGEGPARLRRGLYQEGGLDAVIEESLQALTAARQAAVEAQMHGAAGWLQEREGLIRRVREEALRKFFQEILR